MDWTAEQMAELKLEYRRAGISEGELLPFPDPPPSPAEFLAMVRSIPDAAGTNGYLEAMARRGNKSRP